MATPLRTLSGPWQAPHPESPALSLLRSDLLDCGVPPAELRPLETRYERALKSRTPADWIELYLGIFATLGRFMHRTRAASAAASERIQLLLNDDLGTRLFDEESREALACGLRRRCIS